MKQVMDRARSRRLPIFTCEPASDLNDLARAIMAKRASALWHVYITGPRATRWRDGEEFGRSIVRALASHLIGTDNLIVA